MTRGYTLPRPKQDAPDPWNSFEWQLDGSYNIAAVTLTMAHRSPERTALRHVPLDNSPTSVTYKELDEASDAIAAIFREQGVSCGDRVAVCLPQCPELVIAHLAAFKLGAIVVPLSMLLGTNSFEYSLKHSEPTLLVIDATRAAELDLGIDDEITVIVEPEDYATSPLGGFDGSVTSEPTPSLVRTAPDDPALILYTSGTTGKPKGVVQGHRYLAGSLPGYQAWFQLFDDAASYSARVWTPAEWAWAGALFDVVFPTLAIGGTVVSRERRTGFDPADALALIDDERVTHTFMPATALQRLRREANISKYNATSLEVVMSGGESLPEPLLAWAQDTLAPAVHETYGQTEANALIGNCTAAYDVRPGSMGHPYPGHDVLVVDEHGTEIPAGKVGEIAVQLPDPVVFCGYWKDKTATEERFHGNLFLTGDLAVQDEDGYFWHRGRKDDLILTAGYRVSPLEVEAALEDHPAVVDSVVGGIPDPERGEHVKAFVVPADDAEENRALAESIRETVRKNIGTYKVPRDISFIDSLPETRSGKTDRSALFD